MRWHKEIFRHLVVVEAGASDLCVVAPMKPNHQPIRCQGDPVVIIHQFHATTHRSRWAWWNIGWSWCTLWHAQKWRWHLGMQKHARTWGRRKFIVYHVYDWPTQTSAPGLEWLDIFVWHYWFTYYIILDFASNITGLIIWLNHVGWIQNLRFPVIRHSSSLVSLLGQSKLCRQAQHQFLLQNNCYSYCSEVSRSSLW
jgi:hypothetical protein